jgi:molybdenum cofactor cytidylyltransferase
MISSILITAGLSSRMGQHKALLKIGHISVIEYIMRELIPISEEVVIIVGDNYEAIKNHLLSSFLDLENVHFVVNQEAHLGMFSSVRKGFSFVSGQIPILLQMIDQPFVDENTYEKLVESFDQDHFIFQPEISQDGKFKVGHPILFSPNFREVILAESNEGNLRDLIRKFQNKRKFLEVDDPGILQNINTPEEFEKILKGMKL